MGRGLDVVWQGLNIAKAKGSVTYPGGTIPGEGRGEGGKGLNITKANGSVTYPHSFPHGIQTRCWTDALSRSIYTVAQIWTQPEERLTTQKS